MDKPPSFQNQLYPPLSSIKSINWPTRYPNFILRPFLKLLTPFRKWAKKYSHSPSTEYIVCSAWNKFCRLWNKRGHFQRVCKATIEEDFDEFEDIKMLYDELKWIISQPPAQPYIRLQVRVDTKAFHQNNFKQPSAYRHRSAEMPVLADTGCQACVIGVLGAIFIIISCHDAERKTWETHHLHLDEARNHPQNISYCWQLCWILIPAFNKCTRQTLPLMRVDRLPIPVRKDAKPVEVHTPVPIPLHWEEKVKRDLLRDVSLCYCHYVVNVIIVIIMCYWTSSSQYPCHLVSQDGDSSQTQWGTQENSWYVVP